MKTRLPLILFIFIISASWCYAQRPVMWGTSSGGGTYNDGTIFKVNAAGKETVTYDFGDQVDDGASPWGHLIYGGNGLFYGLTLTGGAYGAGTIFSYDTSTGTENVLSDFDGGNGELPDGSLIQASNGVLYGTTFVGGANNDGVIFSYNISTGTETDIHDFGSGTDGSNPFSTLLQASNGLLYGLTHAGGTHAVGTIFTYNLTTGAETDVHDFGSGTDGRAPLFGPLIQLNDSLLYGTTQQGGTFSGLGGTIFSYNINTGTETDLYNFGNGNDGNCVDASVIRASNGLLYGTTLYGGADSGGIIFSYNIATTTETIVHSFGSGTDGQTPYGSLVQSCNSLLYGMTGFGGKDSSGIIFSYNIATGAETDLHDFGSGSDGRVPYGSVMLGKDSIPLLNVTPQSPTICSGTGITIMVTGGLTYSWTPVTTLSDSTGDSVIATPTITTVYSVTGVGGCAPAVTDTVKVLPATLTVIPPSAIVCTGLSTTLTISGGGSDLVWSPSASLSNSSGSSVVATPTVTTTYTVTGIDSPGCAATGTEVITVVKSPNQPTFHQHGDTLISSSQTGNQWYLNKVLLTGDTSQRLVITDTGDYWVIVNNEANGCSAASDSVDITAVTGINQLTVNSGQLTVFPNPFTNDVFVKINSSAEDVKDWSLQLTDVLGRTLYSTPLNPLKGTFEVDLSYLPNAMYFIAVVTKTGRVVVPVVKE